MNNKYRNEFVVPCYATDASWRMKASSFMNIAQEAANIHADHLGFGYDDLIKNRTAWILSRMTIKFIKTPLWRENINIETWHKGLERLFYLRDFQMTDSEGKVRALATTSWLVLDIDSRKLVRNPGLLDDGTVCKDNAIEVPCGKIVIPKDVEQTFVYEHKVAYSDIDTVGHTNNAKYAEWAMNAIDFDFIQQHELKEVNINFNHETRIGDDVAIFKTEIQEEEASVFYIEGKVADSSAFIIKLTFSDKVE